MSAKSLAALDTATSMGRRSVDEPVQNPWPVVLSRMYCASAGFSRAAPCATRMTSGWTSRHFAYASSVIAAVSSRVIPPWYPLSPPCVVPAWKQKMCGLASPQMRMESSSVNPSPTETMFISSRAYLSISISLSRVIPAELMTLNISESLSTYEIDGPMLETALTPMSLHS